MCEISIKNLTKSVDGHHIKWYCLIALKVQKGETIEQREIGKRLKLARGSISKETVCNAVGVTKRSLEAYEQGTRAPRDEMKLKLANYYGKSVEELFFYESELHSE